MATHEHDLSPFTHEHHFGAEGADARATALWQVTALTLATMLLELVFGYWSGSLALTADGWHMGTHALALGGAALAMLLAQRAQRSRRFAFGGWKIEMLAAYTSSLLLLAMSASLVWQALDHLRDPGHIAYVEAMVVALIGLLVNVASAWLLSRPSVAVAGGDHAHTQAHAQAHAHGHDHHGDTNFRAAWLHVMADLFTSVLALAALAGGLWFGWRWLDPVVALVGAVIIARWAWGVLGASVRALIDANGDVRLQQQIRQRMEADGDTRVADLHVWQIGAQAHAAALSVVADAPRPTAEYQRRLHDLPTLRHVTLEVHRCPDAPSAVPRGAD
jgi:cation diffusion facilitator family transporter